MSFFAFWKRISRYSEYLGHSQRKLISSSTTPKWHILQTRSSSGMFLYLPISISSGSIPLHHIKFTHQPTLRNQEYQMHDFGIPDCRYGEFRWSWTAGITFHFVNGTMDVSSLNLRIHGNVQLVLLLSDLISLLTLTYWVWWSAYETLNWVSIDSGSSPVWYSYKMHLKLSLKGWPFCFRQSVSAIETHHEKTQI